MSISVKINELIYSNKGKNTSVLALKKIDLFFEPKQFVCIVGPSGCGKTTLMNIIGGLVKTPGQEILINNKTLNKNHKLGYVFQNSRLLPWLSLYDNIKLVCSSEDKEIDKRIHSILENFDLKDFKYSFPKTISGGMRRKVALARAFVNEPEVLLMDEPFVSLDQPTTENLYESLIDYWNKHPTTIIFITHSLKEALLLGDRILFFKKRPGTILLDYRVRSKRKPLNTENEEVQKEYNLLNTKYPNLLKGI